MTRLDEPQLSTKDARKTSFWRRLGGNSLSFSVIVHALLLGIGVVWIFQTIPEKQPQMDFMPKGGGGGQPSSKAALALKKRATMTTLNAPRLAAKGASGSFVLPEPDASSSMISVGALSSGGLSAGLGGSGSGGGRGDGKGTGFGNGSGPGLGGGGAAMSPFGMINPNANALVGNFYDLKQTKDRKLTNITSDGTREVIKQFISRGWNERGLEKEYFKAPQRLYQTKIYIPLMSAAAAPKAFNCEKEVAGSRWVVIYRGMVTPPKTGKYRFVGAADDTMVVRFNKRSVFDHGFSLGTTGVYAHQLGDLIPVLSGTSGNKELERKLKGEFPMQIPVTLYQYDTTLHWNRALGGMAVGPEFEARAGTSYPIDILISEIPGGGFSAVLMIEEVGASYPKTSGGSPILPIFRLDGSLPPASNIDDSPPYDPQGPVWKLVGGSSPAEI